MPAVDETRGGRPPTAADVRMHPPQGLPQAPWTPAPPEDPDPCLIYPEDVADMQAALAETYADRVPAPLAQTVVLDGFGCAVRVHRGELECVDGVGEHRRTRRISRADAAAGRLRRVLVLGDGYVTTDAYGWCAAVGVALVVTDRNGAPLAVGTPELYAHGALRRAQALASYAVSDGSRHRAEDSPDESPAVSVALRLAREILDLRLSDQESIAADSLGRPDEAAFIGHTRTLLGMARDVAEMMVAEMHAAELYWEAWAPDPVTGTAGVELHFATADRTRVPRRWRSFGGRGSPLGEVASNRHAGDPVNALLNYGYRLAEIEAVMCARAVGLDPGIGLAHADGLGRPALALDLMEAARGVVERTVLGIATTRTFRKRDFTELPSGEVRVQSPLTHDLAVALAPALRDRLAPVAEHVAGVLARLSPVELRVPSVLTGARRRAAQAIARGRAPEWVPGSDPAPVDRTSPAGGGHDPIGTGSTSDVMRPSSGPAGRNRTQRRRTGTTATTHALSTRLWSCPGCGGPVTNRRHVRCPACIAADPRQTPERRGARGAAIQARKRSQAAWVSGGGAGTFDPTIWPTILAGLTGVKLAEIVAVTGLSKGYASYVRAGKFRPHPSHWPALATLARVELPGVPRVTPDGASARVRF